MFRLPDLCAEIVGLCGYDAFFFVRMGCLPTTRLSVSSVVVGYGIGV